LIDPLNYVLTGPLVLLILSLQAFSGVYVRKLLTAVVTASLSLLLIQSAVLAAPAKPASAPLGVVMAAENANVGAGVTSSGATIYDGDRLQTAANSSLRVRLGSGQMLLRDNTLADVHAFPNGFSANLGAGTVVVSSPGGQNFQVLADGAMIRPANAQPTSGQVTMMSPTELILTSTRGTLEVSMGDEVKTVEAGSTYRLEVESADPGASPNPQVPIAAGKNHFLWILIPVVGVVTGLIIWRAVMSPSSPN
jgi:hypothetical protein